MFSKKSEFNFTDVLKKNFPTFFKDKIEKDKTENLSALERKLLAEDKYAIKAKFTGFATGFFVVFALSALLLSIGFIIP